MNTHGVIPTIALLFVITNSANALMCYSCFNIECKGPQSTCADIRAFMVTELKRMYSFSSLDACPDVEDLLSWKVKQVEAEASGDYCVNDRHNAPACALSRLRILTEMSYDEVIVSHATVMGCARHELMSFVSTFQRQRGNQNKCASSMYNVTSSKLLKFSYDLETCPHPDYCNHDFCINPQKSIVLPFLEEKKKDRTFDMGLIWLIVAVVCVLIMTALLSTWCETPLNRPSNMSTRV